VVVVVVLFGSTQIPKLARSLGSAQKEFKKGLDDGAADAGRDETTAVGAVAPTSVTVPAHTALPAPTAVPAHTAVTVETATSSETGAS